ncbi:LysR family transcriptional regulator [Tolypothrix bouteillei VB521301]|uniref:LysR family transcriptional regulator n=1 Tax=Tolypothrix bouteillei VB521301 TaxID=1479485 RepID=A0A8S9TIF9_9CYAN|nr:LysR family transcriptional regulator [Tolypothrix bouteillei VB521301]
MDWNDLRIVQAIARTHSLASAARELGVHQSTVFRRLNALFKCYYYVFVHFYLFFLLTPIN